MGICRSKPEPVAPMKPASAAPQPQRRGAKPGQPAALDSLLFPQTDDKQVDLQRTFGLVKVTLEAARLQADRPRRFFGVVSIGEQSYVSKVAGTRTLEPVWGEGHNLVLQRGGATRALVSIYAAASRSEPQALVGYCDVDLAPYFEEGASQLPDAWLDLLDPGDKRKAVGQVRVSTQAATLPELEKQFWGRILALVDFNADQRLSLEEFTSLMQAFGNDLLEDDIAALFRKADTNQDGTVSEAELAELLSQHKDGELHKLMKRCPVSGAELTPGNDYGNLIYMTLCMDEGTGNSLQGGFQTPEEATRGWMLKLSEWAAQPLAGSSWLHSARYRRAGGLNVGARAAHILVFDRRAKRIIEEAIQPHLVLAMRNLYQSKAGRLLLSRGATARMLLELTEREGRHMNSPESTKEIPNFLKVFRGQLDVDDIADPVDSFATFNEFFYRKLKPAARPIAEPSQPEVVVSAADSRLTAFTSISDATRFWIKGRHFSLAGLLAETADPPGQPLAQQFAEGTMVIFRLAPQDYHRFHFPVGGTLQSIRSVPGHLYTVNPIAINSPYADVFTQNKRAVCTIQSPLYGQVVFVAVGATMVGSIVFTAEPGKAYAKGNELGYFAFGGSTTILLLQPGAITLDADLLTNSKKSLETLVQMGERIGVRPGSTFEASPAAAAELQQHTDAQTQGVAALPPGEPPELAAEASAEQQPAEGLAEC